MKLDFLINFASKVKDKKKLIESSLSKTALAQELIETKQEIDKIYQDNKHNILPYINFAKSCIMDATLLPTEEVRIIDYIDLSLKIKENYNEYLTGGKFINFFPKDIWTAHFSMNLSKEIYNLINKNYKSHCKLLASDSEGGNNYYTVDFENYFKDSATDSEHIKFAFIENPKEGGLISFFIEKNNIENSLKLIKKLFFENFNSNKIIVSFKNKKISFEEDKLNKDFIMFQKCQSYIDDINKFLSKNHNRSILFYGPPGSGKSNIIAGIISTNSLSTIKFTNLNLIDSNSLIEIIKILTPDCIVLEDLDHAQHNQLNLLLEKIEQLTSNVKLILGSANQVSLLDNALIRPGRFDQAIEINRLDDEVIMNLVHNDQELFELTKSFPVAYIKELMKRVDVLGKEEALASMQDIQIRVQNLNNNNYSLHKDKNKTSYALSSATDHQSPYDEEEEEEELENELYDDEGLPYA